MNEEKIEIGHCYLTESGVIGKAIELHPDTGRRFNIITDILSLSAGMNSYEPFVTWNYDGSSTNSATDDKCYTVVKEVFREQNPEYFL